MDIVEPLVESSMSASLDIFTLEAILIMMTQSTRDSFKSTCSAQNGMREAI